MPLQNRVEPDGSIHNSAWRGDFMGNRGGRIHDPATRTLTGRIWASKRWITCVTCFKSRQRQVMGNGYTELFFLDEASSLAAGHRPCFECRRADANRFAETWETAIGSFQRSRADEMDAKLHEERTSSKKNTLSHSELSCLPDGTFVCANDSFYAKMGDAFFLWGGHGYSKVPRLPETAYLLTPPSTVRVLAAGYTATWHRSLAQRD